GVGREEPVSHRRGVHGELGVPESEHHVHGADRACRGACGRGDEAGGSLMNGDGMTRRQAGTAVGAAIAGASVVPGSSFAATMDTVRPTASRFKQSVSRWCYGKIPLDQLCELAKGIGYQSVELLSEPDWPAVRTHGLQCAMANGFGSIPV